MALESRFKTKLIKELEEIFPGIVVIHLDPNDIQGIGDLLLLYGDRWAILEGKRAKDSPVRPNQEYYVNLFNEMSFSRFIYPENKDAVLHELQQAFRARRTTRVSKR